MRLTLTITPTMQSLVWDLGGGGAPIVEGAGNWADGSTDFTDISSNAGATFSNASNSDVTFGNDPAGSGGAITLTGNVRTGGAAASSARSTTPPPPTPSAETATRSRPSAASPPTPHATLNTTVELEASQSWSVSNSKILTANGNIIDGAGGAKTLTKTGGGVLQLHGSNTFSGGLIVSAGTVEANTDAAVGAGAVTIDNNSTFKFTGAFATDNDFVIAAAGAASMPTPAWTPRSPASSAARACSRRSARARCCSPATTPSAAC